MLHISCDLCGKELRPGEDSHFVVKIEVFAVPEANTLTEADLDEDHLEAVGQILREMEDSVEEFEEEVPTTQHLRYDLCPCCRKKFLHHPLGKEVVHKLYFSQN